MEIEVHRVRWSPAEEVIELACGYEPKAPDGPVDLAALEHLVESYRRLSESSAYNDLMRRVEAMERQLTSQWKSGKDMTPQEQGAARALHYVMKIPDFAERRLRQAATAAMKMSPNGANERHERNLG